MSPTHWTLAAAGASGATGAIVSCTWMICDALLLLPQASVKVHVRLMVEPQPWASATGALSTGETVIEPEQLSCAVSWTAAGMSPAHWTLAAAGATGATGAIVSFTWMLCDALLRLPQASAKVQVRVIV